MPFAPSRVLPLCLAAALFAMPIPLARADTSPTPDRAEQNKLEWKAAVAAAQLAQTNGPAQIRLGDQGALALPAGYYFVPKSEANRMMRAMGNEVSDQLMGLVAAKDGKSRWFATVEFMPEGYIKDDDAKSWDTKALLANMQEATLAGNADRKERGFAATEMTGWIEEPRYDSRAHRLVWSAMVRDIGAPANEGSVNYNTYALGRDGYVSLDLVTSPDAVANDKRASATLLAAIQFDKGKGYEDFDAKTDHIAEYGIAALIGGVALKKLGLLALGAAFALKFAKIIGLAAFAAIAGARRFFRRS